jgi:Fusaric acid resistance protein family
LGISAGVVMFAIFFPETPQWATRRFFRQVRVHMSQLAATQRPSFSAFDFALCEQLASTLERLKDEPALARDCLVRGAIGLSSGWAIERLATGVDANRQTAGVSAGISGLLAGLSRVYLRPSWARLTRTAWDARVVSRRLLAKARAADKPADSDALLVLAVACEALRSNLLRNRLFVREEQDAVRS